MSTRYKLGDWVQLRIRHSNVLLDTKPAVHETNILKSAPCKIVSLDVPNPFHYLVHLEHPSFQKLEGPWRIGTRGPNYGISSNALVYYITKCAVIGCSKCRH